ncbi:MAG: PQQ-dependent sugar dehydrogenase, partial [Steroidobacteraceae bacterium]|nr:PQQ-dependent sugar dehydrogenase [Steroidobacteraceae bacterium]
DGGSGGDPFGTIGNGQNLQTLLGKMLRIDISGSTGSVPYRVPAGNPFAGNPLCNQGAGTQNCPEIYAYGFRNPWRWSFDRDSGELWVGDVGQNAWEEIDKVVLGGNYGWRCREGAHPFNSNCGPATNLLDPVAEYGRAAGASVTGGYVYRGTALPGLVGRYVFGDFVSGRIWHIARDTAPTLTVTSSQGLDSGLQIASFGQGLDGEIYIVNYSGTLHRLTGSSATTGNVPNQLSATNCVDMAAPGRARTNTIPYAPNAPFWSDGADKERFIALPDGQNIQIGADNDWTFPINSVLVKNFRLGTRLVETRLFMRHTDGSWAGYTYEWNAAGTDATRVIGGKTVSVNGQSWIFPSEAQCLACHTDAAGRVLGLETGQLNGDLLYTATGRTANQLTTLNTIGVLTPALTNPPAGQPLIPSPNDTTRTLTERAR